MPNQMDMLVSKGKGKGKAMEARLAGVVGVFRTLAEQHAEVEVLLTRVQRDAEKRQALWPKLRTERLSHDRAEVQEVYPERRAHPPTRVLADRHDAEASQLEQLIQRLDALELSSDAWGTLFDQLAEAITRHATEEETKIFPLAQTVIGEPRAQQLDERFLAAKKRIAESA